MTCNVQTRAVTREFKIQTLQCLDHDGQILGAWHEQLDNTDALRALYRAMILTRLFDTKAINLQRTGRLGTYPSILGQEAISVAIGYTMQTYDVLVPYYRDQGAQIMRGVKMEEILLYWGGDERGSAFTDPRVQQDFPICVPIATQCLHAAGVATAFKLRKQARCAVTTIGEGGTSKGDFYEAMNVAGTWQLPLVMVINNNQWAISVPRAEQCHTETLAQKAFAADLVAWQVDGNDVLAVASVMLLALAAARDGQPVLIEAISYRMGDHTTADDASRYRTASELTAAKLRDPVVRYKKFLMAKQLWNDEQELQLQQECQLAIEQAVKNYLAMPRQDVNTIFDYLYAELPACYQPQRELVNKFQHEVTGHG